MKFSLRMCFDNVKDFRNALRMLSQERLESNACGTIQGVDFDYDFVNSQDLYSDDAEKPVVKPSEPESGPATQ